MITGLILTLRSLVYFSPFFSVIYFYYLANIHLESGGGCVVIGPDSSLCRTGPVHCSPPFAFF